MFWSLNEQTAALFPLQATRMNGDLGFYTVKPDQLQLVMQLLIITLLPLCDLIFYPILNRIGIQTVLLKIVFCGFVSMAAFAAAGLLEIRIAATLEPLHIIWLLPQYVLLAIVEAMVTVLGMLFAHSESPTSLRTVMQAIFLTTHSVGNLYDVAIFSIFSFSNQVIFDIVVENLVLIIILRVPTGTYLLLVCWPNVGEYVDTDRYGAKIQKN